MAAKFKKKVLKLFDWLAKDLKNSAMKLLGLTILAFAIVNALVIAFVYWEIF